MPLCPEPEVLSDLLSDRLTPELAGPVLDHLRGCSECQTALNNWPEQGTLRKYLVDWRAAGRNAPDNGWAGAMSLIASRVKQAASGLPDRQPADCVLGLGPPQRPGDIGTLGTYAIECVLGRGGMGTVFRALDLALNRTVAIKMLRPGAVESGARDRIVQEARVAARIKHDHVVAIHAVHDPSDGLPYLVMEYLDGPTLGQLIHSDDRPAPHEAARLIAEVAEGLSAAHRAGVIHRDIKPNNIILERSTGRAKLTDFGLARHAPLGDGLTQEGTIAGTPAYMSPEQARGIERLDVRTDVYSLGATFRELLTGEPPFRGAAHQVLHQVVHDEPPSPRRLNGAIPSDLETICLVSMAKPVDRRYPTAKEFADDLRRWLAGEPIRARPVGRAERAWRWCRRKPALAALFAALALSVSLGFAGVIWQWRRAEAGWEQAQHQSQRAQAGYLKAHQAVDTFYTQFSENELVIKAPGLEAVRRQLLERAQQYYEEFVTESSDDPALARERVRAAARLARVIAAQGSMKDTVAAFRRWVELARQFAAANPDNEEARRELGMAMTLCSYQDRDCDGPERAIANLAEARSVWDGLEKLHPGDLWLEGRRATNDMLRGACQIDAGRAEEGRKTMTSGCRIWERLVDAHPDKEEYVEALALARVNLAQRVLDVDPHEALRLFVAATAAFRHRIATDAPLNAIVPVGVPGEYTNLVVSRHGEAMALSALGRNEAAIALFQELRESLEIYRREHPDVMFGPSALGETMCGLGELQLRTNCPADARASLAEAYSFTSGLVEADPLRHTERRFLAQIVHDQGLAEEALGNAEAARTFWERAVAEQQLAVEQAPWMPAYRTNLEKYRSDLERVQSSGNTDSGPQ